VAPNCLFLRPPRTKTPFRALRARTDAEEELRAQSNLAFILSGARSVVYTMEEVRINILLQRAKEVEASLK